MTYADSVQHIQQLLQPYNILSLYNIIIGTLLYMVNIPQMYRISDEYIA